MPTPASKASDSPLEENINRYFPYLIEIRRRLLLTICFPIISAILGFFYYDRIVLFLVKLFQLQGINIVFTSPFQYVELAMSSALLIGLVSAIPFIIWQLMLFLKPALRPGEFKLILFMLPLSIVLFIAGFIFGLIIMNYVFMIFQQSTARLQIGNYLDISSLLSSVLTTSALMGLAFQFPLVLTALLRFRIIKAELLIKNRPWAYLISYFFAVLLPPTDVLSSFLLALPLVILFELTLLLNWFLTKTKQGGEKYA